MLSLREFAKITGTSPATVSRVFSGSDKVAPETKKRLIELAGKLNFRPSAVLATSSQGRTKSIGVLYPGHPISYFTDMIHGIQEELLAKNYLPIQIGVFKENILKAFHRLVDHKIDGLIISIPTDGFFTQKDFFDIIKFEIPTVFLSKKSFGIESDFVSFDGYQGGKIAAEYLLELGHRKIGMLESNNCPDRIMAFRETLLKNNVPLEDKFIAKLENPDGSIATEEETVQQMTEILSKPDRPTAVFAPTDILALKVYNSARVNNLKIPEDLSVIGYANLRFSHYASPPLTTINQDGGAEGKTAAKLIIKKVENEGAESAPQKILIPAELVIRESTAPLKQK
jgi:LacI family transcriptional regulator